jgi:hypothetical protein
MITVTTACLMFVYYLFTEPLALSLVGLVVLALSSPQAHPAPSVVIHNMCSNHHQQQQ